MSGKRISKKELKEDAFVSAAFETSHFIKENLTKIILGTVSLFIVVGGIWLYVNYRAERKAESSLALFKAENVYMNGNFAVAATDFDKVAEEYSGTVEGDKAVFFAGDSYFKAGQYDMAKERFEQARKELSASSPLMVNCVVGLAAVAEQQGDTDKAVELYREALEMCNEDYQKVIVMGDLSRALASAGKNDEAIKVMDEIVEKFPENPRTPLIKEYRAELKARMTAGGQG